MELFRRERSAFGHNRHAIATVEVGALYRTIVPARNAHVGPIDVASLSVNAHAVGPSAIGDKDFFVRAVGIYGEDPAAAQFKDDEAARRGLVRHTFWFAL